MRRLQGTTTKRRRNARRGCHGRGRGTCTESKPSAAPPEVVVDHADVIGDLLDCERKLTEALSRTRARIDVELIAAQSNRASSKELAFAVQQRLGLATTADELERVSRLLRQRTTVAHRRGAAASPAGKLAGAQSASDGQHVDMTHDPYLRRRRIVEEEFGPPPGGDLGEPEDLNGDDDEFDDDPADHDLGDPNNGPPTGPR